MIGTGQPSPREITAHFKPKHQILETGVEAIQFKMGWSGNRRSLNDFDAEITDETDIAYR